MKPHDCFTGLLYFIQWYFLVGSQLIDTEVQALDTTDRADAAFSFPPFSPVLPRKSEISHFMALFNKLLILSDFKYMDWIFSHSLLCWGKAFTSSCAIIYKICFQITMVCIQSAVGLVAGISEEPFLSVCTSSSLSWMPLEHQTWASFEERLNMLQSKGCAALEHQERKQAQRRQKETAWL